MSELKQKGQPQSEHSGSVSELSAVVKPDASGMLPKNLPDDFSILVTDEAVCQCDTETLKMQASELKRAANYLRSIGYSYVEFRDPRTCESGIRFIKA